jgi:hypothetical protein
MLKIFILVIKGNRILLNIELYYRIRICYLKIYLYFFRKVNFSLTYKTIQRISNLKEQKKKKINNYYQLLKNNNISL